MNHFPDTRYWFNKLNFELVAYPFPIRWENSLGA